MSSTVLFDAPGPRTRRRHLILTVISAALLLFLAYLVFERLADKGQLAAARWDWVLDPGAWTNYLLKGLLDTLRAAGISIVLSSVLALVLAMARMSEIAPLRWAAGIFVEFFRAVPVLLMMVFFWLLLANGGVENSSFWGVVIALVLYNGSVVAELVRSGVHGLPSGQREAALSVGLTRGQSLRSVEVPQALVAMLPALVSQLVVVLKDSALGAIISYSELLQHARRLGSGQGNILQALTVAAVLFIVVNYSLSKLAERLSRTLRRTSGKTGTMAAGLDAGVGAGATAVATGPAARLDEGPGAPGTGPGDRDHPTRWS